MCGHQFRLNHMARNRVPFSNFKAVTHSDRSLFMLALSEEGSLWKEVGIGHDKVKYSS